ncbi:MAG: hypothetical protein ACWGMZ_00400 [Thermoguttaceae bacterium]
MKTSLENTKIFYPPSRNMFVGLVFVGLCFIPTLSAKGYFQAKTTAADQDADDSDGWIFDNAPYTNDPKTGKRVNQYRPEKKVYRDPYSLFDSPHSAFPFESDTYDSFFYGFPYYNTFGEWPYNYPYSNSSETNGMLPYDGDPND